MTSIQQRTIDSEKLREFDRGVLRSAFSSLFWSVIMHRRKRDKYKLQSLADEVKKDKSEVSRWFSKPPNWQLNTISDIAGALDLEIEIRARERSTGIVFAPYGVVREIRAEIVDRDSRPVLTSEKREPEIFGMAVSSPTSSLISIG